jgi:hypothetical protein
MICERVVSNSVYEVRPEGSSLNVLVLNDHELKAVFAGLGWFYDQTDDELAALMHEHLKYHFQGVL